MKLNKVLVTGGAGFVGSHLVDELISKGIETYVIDNLSSGSLENLSRHNGNDLFHLTIGDIRNIEYLMPDIGDDIDAVFHEAAYVSVPQSITNPIQFHDVNVDGTFKLMNHCLKKDVKKFIFASSAAVYDGTEDPVSVETCLCKPTTPYGASKAIVEMYLNAYWKSYGLKSTSLRYFNIYGPRQRYNIDSGVITIFVDKMLKGERPTIFGDGNQTRDFVNVKDIVQANILAAESDSSAGEIFNVGTGKSTSLLGLVDILNKASGNNLIPIFEDYRPGDSRLSMASIAKIKNVLGYEPSVELETGLNEMLRGKLP